MKPIIGIAANFTSDPRMVMKGRIGLPDQKVHYLAEDYTRSIQRAGGTPVILPSLDQLDDLNPIFEKLDGILFTGGSDIDPSHYGELPKYGLGMINPYRDRHEIQFAKKALAEMELPILAICRGCQLLNVVSGGTLYQDLQTERPNGINHTFFQTSPKHHPTHSVKITPDSRLYSVVQTEEIRVNSFHHQAIKELGNGFKAVGIAPDGLIEAIEFDGKRFVVGVQWHPEMMFEQDPKSQQLFKSFIKSCVI